MEKTFDPKSLEAKWYAQWEASGLFAPSGDGEPYCILLPPPNVTGTLHMGHAFQMTIMDALIRYQRMHGRRTLWQGGTDHAGIATQKIVENQLAAQGKTRHDLGREKFIERVWEWKAESGSTITSQMRRLGASMDWSRERFTMDQGLSAAVRKVFVQWYRDGLLYRGKRLVHWDPVLMTAVLPSRTVSSPHVARSHASPFIALMSPSSAVFRKRRATVESMERASVKRALVRRIFARRRSELSARGSSLLRGWLASSIA